MSVALEPLNTLGVRGDNIALMRIRLASLPSLEVLRLELALRDLPENAVPAENSTRLTVIHAFHLFLVQIAKVVAAILSVRCGTERKKKVVLLRELQRAIIYNNQMSNQVTSRVT